MKLRISRFNESQARRKKKIKTKKEKVFNTSQMEF